MARKILLADDSVTAQNMGRKILADAGYEVITVNNGSAALKKIGDARPDLIVLDVYMPGYSGLEVCQRLKEVADTARIPILLTVGKLEPFKPEEARRVRADGFIVKPFEASELLSALSKLEDKVVPRADSSKPGRFARATAAIEEGRYDKTMAVEEDDSGWKSRISFPKKKKEKPAEEEVQTGEIYNPVNKDLRTVVEHKVEPAPHAPAAAPAEPGHAEQAHVNVGALAPEGLPKDVTPEEIAALAAAAAQIKGKVVEEKHQIPVAEVSVTAPPPVEVEKSQPAESPKPESVEAAKVESKEEVRATEPTVAAEVPANTPPATLAAQETSEKIEEKKPEHKSGPAEVMAAIAGLETEWISLPAAGLANGPFTARNERESTEPVTMAVAAASDLRAAEARWTAVAVALPPEEAAISLEQEMQKAYAAFAAAEGGHTATAVAISKTAPPVIETAAAETTAVPAAMAEAMVAEPAATEAAPTIPAGLAPEAVQPLAAVSEAATEAISAAVQELEAVAAKYEAEQNAVSMEPRVDKALKAEALESPAAMTEPDPRDNAEEGVGAKIEEKIEAKAEEQAQEPPSQKPDPLIEEVAQSTPTAEIVAEEKAPQVVAPEVQTNPESEKPGSVTEASKAAVKHEIPRENSISEEVITQPVPVSSASTAGGTDEMAKRESETAAAWASWRKIRETGSSKPAQSEASANDAEDEVPQDRAAMAVAAGAESNPEEVTTALDSDPEIASIVDSVLADMRPKIVEEIARKLGKK